MRNAQVDQLAKQASELALRLAILSADGVHDQQTLDQLEILATRVIKEVGALRIGETRPVGETSGLWPVIQPVRR